MGFRSSSTRPNWWCMSWPQGAKSGCDDSKLSAVMDESMLHGV